MNLALVAALTFFFGLAFASLAVRLTYSERDTRQRAQTRGS
jgi:hypothetical protein